AAEEGVRSLSGLQSQETPDRTYDYGPKYTGMTKSKFGSVPSFSTSVDVIAGKPGAQAQNPSQFGSQVAQRNTNQFWAGLMGGPRDVKMHPSQVQMQPGIMGVYGGY